MDILIYAKPEVVEHKMKENVEKGFSCFWRTGKIPSEKNMNKIKYIYFSDGDKIYARGKFIPAFLEENRELDFTPLEKINLKQPKKPPTRGWCYINKEK